MAQNFKVLHKQVGPFPQLTDDGKPFVFSLDQFKRLHPVPDDRDESEYYSEAIDRLIDLKAIALVSDPSAPDSAIPIGPHNLKRKPFVAPPKTRAEVYEEEMKRKQEPDPKGKSKKELAAV